MLNPHTPSPSPARPRPQAQHVHAPRRSGGVWQREPRVRPAQGADCALLLLGLRQGNKGAAGGHRGAAGRSRGAGGGAPDQGARRGGAEGGAAAAHQVRGRAGALVGRRGRAGARLPTGRCWQAHVASHMSWRFCAVMLLSAAPARLPCARPPTYSVRCGRQRPRRQPPSAAVSSVLCGAPDNTPPAHQSARHSRAYPAPCRWLLLQ